MTASSCGGGRARGRLVLAEAGGGDHAGPAGLAGHRVGGQQHHAGATGRGHRLAQPLDQCDGAEEVHRHHQRGVDAGEAADAGGRYDAVHHVGQVAPPATAAARPWAVERSATTSAS